MSTIPSSGSAQLNPNAAELGDWRIAKTGWVTGMNGEELAQALPFHQVTLTTDIGATHTFVTPSAEALHLNRAWKAARAASQVKASIRWSTGQTLPFDTRFDVDAASIGVLYDYFEETMSCAMSSFAAVEAFCNGVIAEKAVFPMKLTRTKKGQPQPVEWSLEEVERNMPTDEKLKQQLPRCFGKPTPSGKSVWQSYKKLKDLRDTVTHFKRRDQSKHADKSSEPTALHVMTQLDPFTLPEAAMAVIDYFYTPTTRPRWMFHPEWIRPGST